MKDDFKHIETNRNDHREFEGMEPDEIFKQITGYEVPTTEKEKIELVEKLQIDVFRRKICIEIVLKNASIYKWVKFNEFFTLTAIHQDVKDNETVEIPKSTVGRVLHKMAKAGFLNKREFKRFKSKKLSKEFPRGVIYFWLKSYYGEELTKVYNLLKWDEYYLSQEIQDRDTKRLELEIKKPKSNEEVVKTNLDRGELFENEKIRRSIAKNEKSEELKNIKKEKDDLERQRQEILDLEKKLKIKNGLFCPNKATQRDLLRMKENFERSKSVSPQMMASKGHSIKFKTNERYSDKNWFKEHFKSCRMKFEDHPPE